MSINFISRDQLHFVPRGNGPFDLFLRDRFPGGFILDKKGWSHAGGPYLTEDDLQFLQDMLKEQVLERKRKLNEEGRRGQLNFFPTERTDRPFDLFLRDRFPGEFILDKKGWSHAGGPHLTQDDLQFLQYMLKDQELVRKRKLDEEDRPLYSPHQSTFVPTPALKKVKSLSSAERRHVRFDPLLNETLVYSPNSCPIVAPYRISALYKPDREFFDLPAYRGRTLTSESKKKGCLFNDTEGGWVIVDRNDFDDATTPLPSSPDHTSQKAIRE